MERNLKQNNMSSSVKENMESSQVLVRAKEGWEAECYGAWQFRKVS